jgi:hypothetical protein
MLVKLDLNKFTKTAAPVLILGTHQCKNTNEYSFETS